MDALTSQFRPTLISMSMERLCKTTHKDRMCSSAQNYQPWLFFVARIYGYIAQASFLSKVSISATTGSVQTGEQASYGE